MPLRDRTMLFRFGNRSEGQQPFDHCLNALYQLCCHHELQDDQLQELMQSSNLFTLVFFVAVTYGKWVQSFKTPFLIYFFSNQLI